MKTLKYIIFFIKESPKYMNKPLLHLILHEQFFRTMKWYVKEMKAWEKSIKEHGKEETYVRMNKIIEM